MEDIQDGMLLELFVRSLALWWVIIPGMLLGIIVGILPGLQRAEHADHPAAADALHDDRDAAWRS